MAQEFIPTPGGNLYPDPETSYNQSEAFRRVAFARDQKDRQIAGAIDDAKKTVVDAADQKYDELEQAIDDAKGAAIADATQKYGKLPGEVNTIKSRELPDRGRLRPQDYPGGLLTIDQLGTYAVWIGSDAAALELPVITAAKVDVYGFGATITFEVTSYTNGGIIRHIRRSSAGRWTTDWDRQTVSDEQVADFVRTGTATRQEILDIVEAGSQPGGTRIVPLSLTVGAGSGEAESQGTVRYPLHFAPVIDRWRLHVVDVNPRYGSHRSATSALQHVLVGAHAGDGAFTVKPTLIAESGTVNPGGEGWVSDWINYPIGASQQVLSFAYTTTGGLPTALVGAGWQGDLTDAQELAPSLTPSSERMPFHVWIEADVNATVRVIAALGSSSSCGVGANQPVLESFVSQHARRVGALPVHYTASGTRVQDWNYPTHHKWVMWDGYTTPDALIWNIGSNNVYNNETYEDIVTESETLRELLRDRGIEQFYAANIPPRAATTSEQNAVRKEYNEWMRLSGEFLDVFDFSSALSDNNLTILPEFDADGIHYNTAGHNATVETITNNMATVPEL